MTRNLFGPLTRHRTTPPPGGVPQGGCLSSTPRFQGDGNSAGARAETHASLAAVLADRGAENFELLSRVRGSGWQQWKRILRGKPLSRLPLSVLKVVWPFVGHRQFGAQGADIAFDNPGNGAQLIEGQVSLAALDSADVTPVNVGLQRKVLLRKPFCLSRRPYPVAEHLKRSFFQPPKALENEGRTLRIIIRILA